MFRHSTIGIVIGLIIVLCSSGRTDNGYYNFTLAGQNAGDRHRGFFLQTENSSSDTEALTTKTLQLVLGVADGSQWVKLKAQPDWQYDHPYHAHAVIGPRGSTLALDGKVYDTAAIAPQGSDAPLLVSVISANANANYWTSQQSVTLQPSGQKTLRFNVSTMGADAPRLFYDNQAVLYNHSWHYDPGRTLMIDAVFKIVKRPASDRASAPFVDRYGQSRYAQWPSKIQNDRQLQAGIIEEQHQLAKMPRATSVDQYGGGSAAGWHDNATGYYRVLRRNGFWWLITPTGLPCFYRGIDNVPDSTGDATPIKGREYLFAELPPKTGEYAKAWRGDWGGAGNGSVSFHAANLIRKYGSDWERKSDENFLRRMGAWGFTGIGKWCSANNGLPFIQVLFGGGEGEHHAMLDVFDPAVRKAFHDRLESQMQAHKSDPFLVGWSYGNEDQVIKRKNVADLLNDAAVTPAKKALLEYAATTLYADDIAGMAKKWNVTAHSLDGLSSLALTVPPSDIESLRQFYADRYYGFLYGTFKSIDPNHLYMGWWVIPEAGGMQDESDWRVSAKYSDVVGYDDYEVLFANDMLARLMAEADKPALCGEFGFQSLYGGGRGFTATQLAVTTASDAESGALYRQWITDAARRPWCIGVCWFQYRDEIMSGRTDGENTPFGLVDIADQPKWDLVAAMRDINLKTVALRVQAEKDAGH